MKNFLRLFCMVMVLALGLCSGALAIEQSEIEGVWDVDIKPVLVAQGLPEEEVDALLELLGMSMTVTFTPDQQMIMETVAGGEVTQEKFTYTLEGENILMNDGGVSQLVREEDTLTIIDPDDLAMVLTRHGPVEEEADVVIDSELVGVWKVEPSSLIDVFGMSEEEAAMIGDTVEFTTDGRAIFTYIMMGEVTYIDECGYYLYENRIIFDTSLWTYVIEGDTLIVTEGNDTTFYTRVQSVEEAPAA